MPKSTPPSTKQQQADKQSKQQTLLSYAQKGVQLVKQCAPPRIVIRILIFLLILLILVAVALLYILGTNGGTAYLIDKISAETGIAIHYHDGNLRDGLWVTELNIPAGDNVTVSIDSAKVKIGWRAIFDKELHLRDIEVDNIHIVDGNAPVEDDSPFSFPELALPINLRLDHSKIGKIIYEKPTYEPLIFSNIETDDLDWIGTTLTVDDGNLTYGYYEGDYAGIADSKISASQQVEVDTVTVKGLDGKVDFTGDYPIKAKTTATLHHTTEHYFDDVEIKATGSLKNLHANLKSKYNNAKITAEADVQIFATDVPFTATVKGKKVAIPYATDFDIALKNPTIKVAGTWRQMSFDVATELTGKHIPVGHYQAKADFTTMAGEFNITQLIAKTNKGTLYGDGELNWDNDYWMDVQVRSTDYQLDNILPKDWQEFQGFLPERLNGSINFKQQNSNAQGKMQIDTSLYQKDAETVHATVVEMQDFSDSKKPNPYKVTANWTNLKRTIKPELDEYQLEVIDSDEGQAELMIQGDRLDVTAEAQINQLSIAPAGHYKIALDSLSSKKGSDIAIKELDYQGEVGDLTGKGSVTIANDDANGDNTKNDKPILWSLSGHTNGFKPIVYNKDIPIELVQGEFSVSDVMSFESLKTNGKTNESQRHKLTLDKANIQMVLAGESQRNINLDGNAKVELVLDDTGLASFDADYTGAITGAIENADLPKGQYAILAKGTTKNIDIDKLHYQGASGKLEGKGKIGFVSHYSNVNSSSSKLAKSVAGEDTNWQFTADVVDFDLGDFQRSVSGVLTGKIDSAGTLFTPSVTTANNQAQTSQQADELKQFSLKFDGSVNSKAVQSTPVKAHTATDKNKDTAGIKAQTATTQPFLIPTGKWKIDTKGNLNKISVNHLYHQGDAGFIDGQGNVNLSNGYQWDMNAKMKSFNLGLFTEDIASTLTGDVDTRGHWNDKLNKLTGFAVKFDGEVTAENLPYGKLLVDASSNNSQSNTDDEKKDKDLITIKQFRHEGEAGFFNATGHIKLSDDYSWQLQTQMKDFNLGYFLADVPSAISGELNTTGDWRDDAQQIAINNIKLTGNIKNQPLNATGQLSANFNLPKNFTAFIDKLKSSDVEQQYQQANGIVDKLEINDFVVKLGDNYLKADGDGDALSAKVNISNLDQLHSEFKGELTGTVSLKESSKHSQQTDSQNMAVLFPTLYVDLIAKNLTLPKSIGVAITNGKLNGKIVNMGKGDSEMTIIAEELTAGSNTFENLDAMLVGNQDKHKLNLSLDNKKMSMSATLTGSLTKTNKNSPNRNRSNKDTSIQWLGQLSNGTLIPKLKSNNGSETNLETNLETIQLEQINDSAMSINLDTSEITLTPHCWQVQNGSKIVNNGKLCLKDQLLLSQNQGNINLTLQEVDTNMLSFLFPDELQWHAKLNGKADVDWQKGNKPNVNAIIYSDNGKIGIEQNNNSQGYLSYSRISLIALTTAKGLKLRTDIQSRDKSKGYADILINPYKTGKPILGKVALEDLNLVLFKPFFPGMRILEGKGSLNASIAGTLKKPQVDGKFQLTNGRIAMLGLPVDLSKVNLTAKINKTQAKIDGSFYSGEGKGVLTGTVDWQDKLQAKIGLTGNQLELSQPPLLSAKISPDVNIIVKPSKKYLKIKGAVSVPSATFRPPEANAEIIHKSNDVNVLDRRQTDNIDEVLALTEPWSINADIGIDLGEEVNFRGFGAQLPLAGALVVRQRGQGSMIGRGVIQASRRTDIDAFGQTVGLDYAQVRFNGNIEAPNISISASKTIEGSKVGFKVKGNVSEPKITVFNNAGLTEQQAMNALVTGRLNNVSANQVSEEGFRSEVTNNLAAAGLSVGLDTTRNLTNQIGRAVGLQSLTLSASGNSDDTNVNVTGYITPDLYIRYGFGVFNAQSSLSARYQLTRRLYLEATSSTDKFVDLVYNWKF